jgi:hypothetical protein
VLSVTSASNPTVIPGTLANVTQCNSSPSGGFAGPIGFVSTTVNVKPAGNHVFMTASAELGPGSASGGGYEMQFFACWQDATTNGPITPFADDESAQAAGTVYIDALGLFEFTRSGITTTSDAINATDTYSFGLCAIETCRSSFGAPWTNANGTAVGSSKVVVMVVP